jgi:hypothetical protein
METGQADFWNYDFGFIPVELLSGLYESFLSPEEQEKEGAYGKNVGLTLSTASTQSRWAFK